MSRYLSSFLIVFCLAACTSAPKQNPAPIVNRPAPATRPPQAAAPKPAPSPVPVAPAAVAAKPTTENTGPIYIVKKGDGLYRIALDHGLDYRELAEWNNITNVDDIKAEQVLRLTAPENPAGVEVRPLRDVGNGTVIAAAASKPSTAAPSAAESRAYPKALKLPYGTQGAENIAAQAEGRAAKPVASKPANVASKAAVQTASKPTNGNASAVVIKKQEKTSETPVESASNGDESGLSWVAPTAGKLLKPYSVEAKGIDLSGKMGQPVNASESGKVVYAGNGLRGYGKMVIIKHNTAYLTAYAHNSKLLVKEGDVVKRGEKIAEMGNTDTDQVKLHFEVRKFGKPVDPTKIITADRP